MVDKEKKKKRKSSSKKEKVLKKPFYKKWWFIFILGVIVGMIVSPKSATSKPTTKTKESTGISEVAKKDDKSSESTEEKDSTKFYGIGDSVDVDGVVYTLTNVELTDKRNQFDDSNPEYVIKVTYTMENKTDSDVPVGADISAYGPDTKKIDSYPNDNTLGSVASGKSIDVTQHFGLNQLGEVELQFAPLISFEDTANFKVEVK